MLGVDSNSGENASEVDATGNVLDRRAALRAALGGAAAAAVLAGPRVEGFSLVPSYASAATCTVPASASYQRAISPMSGGSYFCLGDVTGSGQNAACNPTAPISLTIGSGITVDQVFSGLVSVPAGQTITGSLAVTYSGLTDGESCTAAFDTTCGSSSASVTYPTTTATISGISCGGGSSTIVTYSCLTCT